MHRERKRTKEKWSSGKLSVQDASCQWSRILKHACTGKHTQADTNVEFLMSEEPTGKHKAGDKQRKRGGAEGGDGKGKRVKVMHLSPAFNPYQVFVALTLCVYYKFEAECMFPLRVVESENLHSTFCSHTHTNTHTDGTVLHSLMPRAVL